MTLGDALNGFGDPVSLTLLLRSGNESPYTKEALRDALWFHVQTHPRWGAKTVSPFFFAAFVTLRSHFPSEAARCRRTFRCFDHLQLHSRMNQVFAWKPELLRNIRLFYNTADARSAVQSLATDFPLLPYSLLSLGRQVSAESLTEWIKGVQLADTCASPKLRFFQTVLQMKNFPKGALSALTQEDWIRIARNDAHWEFSLDTLLRGMNWNEDHRNEYLRHCWEETYLDEQLWIKLMPALMNGSGSVSELLPNFRERLAAWTPLRRQIVVSLLRSATQPGNVALAIEIGATRSV